MKKIYTTPDMSLYSLEIAHSVMLAGSNEGPAVGAPSRIGAPVRRVSVLGSVPTLK